MQRWREVFLGICLCGIPAMAVAEPQPALPQDFLATFQAVDAAYARQDATGIISYYAPDCVFMEATIHEFPKRRDALSKDVLVNLKPNHNRHDLAWQHRMLLHLFSDTVESGFSAPFPAPGKVSATSLIQQSLINRKATELRLTVERKLRLDRGQAQETREEVDEEIWDKGKQGWQLKSRTIHSGMRGIDYS